MSRTARRRALVVAALVAATLLRGWRLDLMSLWTDEGLSFYRAGRDVAGILSGLIPVGAHPTHDVQPPLYFLVLGGWLRLTGFTAWSAKWLSLLAGLPTIPLTWALARRWAGRAAAPWAAALAALSPIYLWYAQEVRPYTLAVTLAALTVYAADRAATRAPRDAAAAAGGGEDDGASTGLTRRRRAPRRRMWAALGAASAAALVYTHFLGFFVLGYLALAVGLGVAREARGARADAARPARRLVPLAALGALVAVAAWPLVGFALRRLGTGVEKDQHLYGLEIMARDALRGFALGRALDFERFAGAVLALELGFAALLAGGAWHLWRTRRGGLWRAAGWLVLPTVAFFLLTLVQPRYQDVRHLMLWSPPFYLLAAAGIVGLARRLPWPRWLGWPAPEAARRALVLGALALAAMAWADLRYYTDDAGHKGDLRGLARYVAQRAGPADLLALSDPVLRHVFDQLMRELPGRDVPRIDLPAVGPDGRADDRRPEAQLAPLLARHERLWAVRPPPALADWLASHARVVDERTFPAGFGIPVRVTAYERVPAAADWPPAMRPVAFGPLTLLGWDLSGPRPPDTADAVWGAAPVPAGTTARVRLAWQADTRARPDLTVALQLLDGAGANLADGDHAPFHGLFPTGAWPFGEVTVEPHDLLVPPDVPPGRYRLAARVYDPAGAAAYPPDGPVVIGELLVAAPAAPTPDDALALDGRLAAAGRGATLVGWRLTRPAEGPFAAGAALPLRAWVRLRDIADPPVAMRAELVDRLGRTVGAATAPLVLGDARAGDLRSVVLEPPLPAAGGRFDLRLRLLDADGRPRMLRRGLVPLRGAWLTAVRGVAAPLRTAAPAMSHPLDLPFGADIVLVGADVAAPVARGATVPITLTWRAARAPGTAYDVTVQLLPIDVADRPTGPPVAQHDGPPAGGGRPTTGWRPGEVVLDAHALAVPADLPAGRYALAVALYEPSDAAAPRPLVVQPPYPAGRDFAVIEVIALGE